MIQKMDQELVNKILSLKKWDFRPCPFCGSEDIGVGGQTLDVLMNGACAPCTIHMKIWAQCNYCGAHGREKTTDIVYPREQVAVAVEGWNHREAARWE